MPRSEDNNIYQTPPTKKLKMASHGILPSPVSSQSISPEGQAFMKRLEAKSTEDILEEINQINALLFPMHSDSTLSSSANHVDSAEVASSNNEYIVESTGEAPIS